MSIDGIGKPNGAAIGGVSGTPGGEAPRATEAFTVERSTAATASSRVSAALTSLQRGELSLDQYLDGRVDEATQHLAGTINPEQLEFVKASLREQMSTDPVLIELVQRATGASPAAELR